MNDQGIRGQNVRLLKENARLLELVVQLLEELLRRTPVAVPPAPVPPRP